MTEAAQRRDRVLLVGVARSGTSWLGHALGRAAGVRFYYEPDNVDADPESAETAGRRGYGPYPVLETGQEDTPFASLWDLVFSGRLPFAVAERRRLRPAARLALRVPRAVRNPMVRMAGAASRRLPARDQAIVVKTIYATFSLDWLLDRYQPQVIAMQRNPLAVVSSWRTLKIPLFDLASREAILSRWVRPFGLEPLGDSASELERIAWHVGLLTHVIAETMERHPGWHFVNHEELCVDPTVSMRPVFSAVGLEWSPGVEKFLQENDRPGEGLAPTRVTRDQPYSWRERLCDAEIEEIRAVLDRFPRRGWVRPPAD